LIFERFPPFWFFKAPGLLLPSFIPKAGHGGREAAKKTPKAAAAAAAAAKNVKVAKKEGRARKGEGGRFVRLDPST